MTHSHHYNVIQSIFTALKILCALPAHLPTTAPITIHLCIVPFPEGHIVGIKKYVAYQFILN